jgi:hypothetical protein
MPPSIGILSAFGPAPVAATAKQSERQVDKETVRTALLDRRTYPAVIPLSTEKIAPCTERASSDAR